MSVESELEEIISQVGDIRDLPRYLKLSQESGHGFQLRMMEPPSGAQVFLKAAIGLGIIGAIGYFTYTQAHDAYTSYQTANHALGDVQTTLHNINILNVPDSGQKILTDIGIARNNSLTAVVDGAKAVVGANVEAVAIALRPWKRPMRKGFVGAFL